MKPLIGTIPVMNPAHQIATFDVATALRARLLSGKGVETVIQINDEPRRLAIVPTVAYSDTKGRYLIALEKAGCLFYRGGPIDTFALVAAGFPFTVAEELAKCLSGLNIVRNPRTIFPRQKRRVGRRVRKERPTDPTILQMELVTHSPANTKPLALVGQDA